MTRKAPEGLVTKVLDLAPQEKAGEDLYTFVISSDLPDLVDDIVVQEGLKPVSKRIPAQVDHSGRMADMIGTWRNLRREKAGKNTRTLADLELFRRGISNMADMVRSMLDSGVQLAASIGFRPIDYDFLDSGGIKFHKSLLTETSVVVVPAHPEALAQLKSFGYDAEQFRTALSEQVLIPKPSPTIKRARQALLVAKRVIGTEQ